MRTYHPDKPVYYIIEKTLKKLKMFCLSEMSYSIIPPAVCTTHHPELIYPTTSDIYTRKIKAKVFLQHGVLGTKLKQHQW